MKRTLISGFALSVTFLAGLAVAHHGTSEYDSGTVREYDGIVAEQQWKNPHNLIVLETESEGEPLRLEIEGAGASTLRTLGVTADSITVGEYVTAVVNPSRRFSNRAAGIEIVKANRIVVPLRSGNKSSRSRQPAERATSILGTWAVSWQAFQGFLRSRASIAFTAEGQRTFDAYSPSMSSQAQCIPVSAPWLMVQVAVQQIEQVGDRIVLTSDWLGGVERTVYLDGREHPPRSERFQQGHSLGRWEDGVLVVDTTNFTDGLYAGVGSSARKHLIERWSLSEDGSNLDYSFVLDDPVYLAEPISATYRWDFRPDLVPSGIDCDLEIAGRFLQELR